MTNGTEGSGDFPKAYIRLRTILDGLELTALRYCLKDNDAAKRTERAEELEKVLMPIVTEYQNKMSSALADSQIECPDGYVNCSGCCVPYPCP